MTEKIAPPSIEPSIAFPQERFFKDPNRSNGYGDVIAPWAATWITDLYTAYSDLYDRYNSEAADHAGTSPALKVLPNLSGEGVAVEITDSDGVRYAFDGGDLMLTPGTRNQFKKLCNGIRALQDELSRWRGQAAEQRSLKGQAIREMQATSKRIEELEAKVRQVEADADRNALCADTWHTRCQNASKNVEELESELSLSKEGLTTAIHRIKDLEHKLTDENILRGDAASRCAEWMRKYWEQVETTRRTEGRLRDALQEQRNLRSPAIEALKTENQQLKATEACLHQRIDSQQQTILGLHDGVELVDWLKQALGRWLPTSLASAKPIPGGKS